MNISITSYHHLSDTDIISPSDSLLNLMITFILHLHTYTKFSYMKDVRAGNLHNKRMKMGIIHNRGSVEHKTMYDITIN